MSLVKWTDSKIPAFSSVFDNFFKDDDGFFNAVSKGTTIPAVNTSETKNMYEMEIAAPGMAKEDFKIEIDNNVLTVSSSKEESSEEEDDDKKYTRKEYSYHSFLRSFRLPENVKSEKIKASYKDGILKVLIPKEKETQPETRSIPVG